MISASRSKAAQAAMVEIVALSIMVSGIPLLQVASEIMPGSAEQSIRVLETENSPPSIQVPGCGDVSVGLNRIFSCTCTDLDPEDQIRLTWYWGDGTLSVTNHQSNGGSFDATAIHRYLLFGGLSLTVWIDDMTGLTGHNVSNEALVIVCRCPPSPPYIECFMADTHSVERGRPVTFTLIAANLPYPDLLLNMQIEFMDGQSATITNVPQGTPWIIQHVFLQASEFFVRANVSGEGGLVFDFIGIEVIAPIAEIQLAPGWNFATVPLVDHGYRASTLRLMTGDVVSGYSTATQTYNRTFTVGSSPPFKDFWILPSEGYWIYCWVAETLNLWGSVPDGTQTRSVTLPEAGGWVILGLASLSTTYKASDIPSWYTGGEVQVVAAYDQATRLYKTWTPGSPSFKDFFLVPGQSYWISCSASGTLSYPS